MKPRRIGPACGRPIHELRQHHLADLIRESKPSCVVGVGLAPQSAAQRPPALLKAWNLWHRGVLAPPSHQHLVDSLNVLRFTAHVW